MNFATIGDIVTISIFIRNLALVGNTAEIKGFKMVILLDSLIAETIFHPAQTFRADFYLIDGENLENRNLYHRLTQIKAR